MATYSRQLLSGAAFGQPIEVVATGDPGTLVHTAIAGTTAFDEIYIWVSNVSETAAALTIQYGARSDPASNICDTVVIPPNSAPIPIVTGQVLNNGLVVRAFGSIASALNITGYVNRIQ